MAYFANAGLFQVVSRRQLLSVVFKAVLAVVNGALKTPNVHSEIVTSLSASNNVNRIAQPLHLRPG